MLRVIIFVVVVLTINCWSAALVEEFSCPFRDSLCNFTTQTPDAWKFETSNVEGGAFNLIMDSPQNFSNYMKIL